MASRLLLLLMFAIAVDKSIQLALDTKDCGSKLGKLSSLDINCDEGSSPDLCKLTIGKDYTGHMKLIPNRIIDNGTIVLHAIVGGVPLPFPFHNSKLCKNHGVVCPLKADTEYTVSIELAVPRAAPEINFVCKVEITSEASDQDLICFEFLGSLIRRK